MTPAHLGAASPADSAGSAFATASTSSAWPRAGIVSHTARTIPSRSTSSVERRNHSTPHVPIPTRRTTPNSAPAIRSASESSG
jgi:hypothetical protein